MDYVLKILMCILCVFTILFISQKMSINKIILDKEKNIKSEDLDDGKKQ